MYSSGEFQHVGLSRGFLGENVKVVDHNPDAYLIYIDQQNLNIGISFSVKYINVTQRIGTNSFPPTFRQINVTSGSSDWYREDTYTGMTPSIRSRFLYFVGLHLGRIYPQSPPPC